MNVNKTNTNAERLPYPRNVDDWREVIGAALNLTPEEGKARYLDNTFPFDDLVGWIRRAFGADKGYSPSFIPALIRNRKGLIAWVYGDGSEPHWPGQDEHKC